MRISLSRHRVLVMVPLSEAALERLDTFFEVDMQLVDEPPEASAMLAMLQDKAGALVDARMPFDAALIRQLPMLRAVSVVEPGHQRLDLDALTNAGIRATNAPLASVDDDLSEGSAAPSSTRSQGDAIAVEGLVASLGFGRRSFHPPHLLNPEVSCMSCC